jgi:hypothetical protein
MLRISEAQASQQPPSRALRPFVGELHSAVLDPADVEDGAVKVHSVPTQIEDLRKSHKSTNSLWRSSVLTNFSIDQRKQKCALFFGQAYGH